jgi:hypothetical protein
MAGRSALRGACSDAQTAGMQALNQILEGYIWSCGS